MPGFDGTGPGGMGSMTGGGRGFCSPWGAGARNYAFRRWAPYAYPSYRPYGYSPFSAQTSPEQEIEILKQQASMLKNELSQIETEIERLSTEKK